MAEELNKKKVAVLMTTFNRSRDTIHCIKMLVIGNPRLDLRFVVVDDNSSDDTVERLKELPYKIHVIEGNGQLYWNGGMHKAMTYVRKRPGSFDYILLVNDDVKFKDLAIEKLIERQKDTKADVVVGATMDDDDKITYGGVRKRSKIFAKFELIEPSENPVLCDTFNCNCVLIKTYVFREVGVLDPEYIHSLGDYDYGMMITKKGYIIVNSKEYVGYCVDNDIKYTWRNTELPRKERLRLKESPKGLPKRDWYHFIRKNYGFLPAIYHSITPYIRILFRK